MGAGSKSFATASRLLDKDTRDSAQLLYAWCRYCDDRIDQQHLGFTAEGVQRNGREALERLERDTRKTLDGETVEDPAFMALARVAQRHNIPERYPLELLQGFRMDVEGYAYETLEDTLLYSYHVAGVVGVMMCYIMGASSDEAVVRAADLGIAFQLTNISRDVMDDAQRGRVYLPLNWLSEAGVPLAGISLPEHRSAVVDVVRRLLLVADRYYDSAAAGLPHLDWRAAWSIATARSVYRAIGSAVIARGPAAWDERVVVSRGQKLLRVLGGLVQASVTSTIGRLLPERPRPDLWAKTD
ncbi:MAG: phytoene/squalene synthase family protein [Gemmatimonadota bacterium]|nr:MAG: phytoene/squalene synthase family protein [Gemmatimonadota bacterium]